MGFPYWAFIGMAVTAVGALAMLVIAYLGQSPRLLKRLGLSGLRLDLRARAFTGFALALLFLAFGFFIAGVPLGAVSPAAEVVTEAAAATPPVDTDESGAMAGLPASRAEENVEPAAEDQQTGDSQPSTGAFSGPPPSALTATAVFLEVSGTGEAPEATATATAPPSATPTSTPTATASPTPSPTLTQTPTPTLTPTPIFEETAVINTGTSTLWLRRTPGGRDIELVKGGDIVILLPGHANVGGAMWREVSTVNGNTGWVLESYLGLESED
jgi:hypothetical protein